MKTNKIFVLCSWCQYEGPLSLLKASTDRTNLEALVSAAYEYNKLQPKVKQFSNDMFDDEFVEAYDKWIKNHPIDTDFGSELYKIIEMELET